MYLRLTPNLLHFLTDLDALYAMRPTFMKSTPDCRGPVKSMQNNKKRTQNMGKSKDPLH
jgi:hypothetical protein